MKKVIIIYIAILISSCTTQCEFTKTMYSPFKSARCSLYVPSKYRIINFSSMEEKERRYIYLDSSFIYISTFSVSPNYYNIRNRGDSIFNFRFQNKELAKDLNETLKKKGLKELKVLPNTFELSGIDSNNLYWKDIYIGRISIGYKNVPKKWKNKYDKSLQTLQIK